MQPTPDLVRHQPRTADRTTRRSAGITAQLDREWLRLRHDPRAFRTTRRWVETGVVRDGGALAHVVDGLRDLDDLLAATHRPGHHRGARSGGRHGDEILLELVALARVDQLAGRIVLQRIVPGLLSRSRRYVPAADAHRTADIVIAAAWIAIRAYDHERRPRQVAAALISDAVFAAFRQPHRRRSASEQVRPHESWIRLPATAPPPEPIEELARVVAEARRRGVESHHLDLLRGLVRAGSAAAVAAELGVTDRTVRARRDRALERVREAVLAA